MQIEKEPPLKRRKLLNGEEVLIEEKESTSWTCFGEHRCCALRYKCIFKWLNIDNYSQCPTCKKPVDPKIIPLHFEGSISENLRKFFFYEWQHEIKRVKRELRIERQRKNEVEKRLSRVVSKIRDVTNRISISPQISSTTTSTTTENPIVIRPPPPLEEDSISNLIDPPNFGLPNQPLPFSGRTLSPQIGEWLSDLKNTIDLYEEEDKEYLSRPVCVYSLQKSINLSSFSQFFLFLNSDPMKVLVDSCNDGTLNQHFLSRGNEVVVRIRILNSEEGERVVEMRSYHQIIGVLSSFGRVLLVDLQTNRFIHTIVLPDDLGTTFSFSDAMNWTQQDNDNNSNDDNNNSERRNPNSFQMCDQTERVQGYYCIIGSVNGKLYFYDQRDWSVPIRMYDVGSVVQTIHPILWQKKQMLSDPKNYQINRVYRVDGTPYVMVSFGRFGVFRCHVIKEVIEKMRVGFNILSSEEEVRSSRSSSSGERRKKNVTTTNDRMSSSSSYSREPYEYCSNSNVFPLSECFSANDRMKMMCSFVGDESIQTYIFDDWRNDQKYDLFKFHISPRYRYLSSGGVLDYPWKRYPSILFSTKFSGEDVMGSSKIRERRLLAQSCGNRTRIYDVDDDISFQQSLETHEFEISHIQHLNTLSKGHFLGELSRSRFCLYTLSERIL